MNESFHIANLFYDMNETTRHSKDPVFYIISTSWFNRWKKYTNFDYYMNNIDKYLKLNSLPNRKEENYINNLDENIKKEVNKFFDSFFLADNSEFYPGIVSNKELIYDKMTHYVNFDKPQSSLNYNILDNLENGNDYFVVTRDIWKYFKGVYGGKEIKRYRIGSSTNNTSNEVFIESKLKTLNVIIIKHKSNEDEFPFIIEKPKYLFLSHKSTLYEFKKQFIEMFSFLKHLKDKDIRFWVLDLQFSFESFTQYINESYSKKNTRISFPGFCLDLLNQKAKFEEFDHILADKTIVMEFIDSSREYFLFKTQHLNDFSQEFQDEIYHISRGKKVVDISNFYDKLIFNSDKEKEKNDNEGFLFRIRKYFSEKYMINQISKLPSDEMNLVLLSICRDDKEDEEKEFKEEIEELRSNVDLLFDKNDLLLKIGIAYSNNFDDDRKKKKEGLNEKLSYESVLKKRKRNKLMEELKGKKMVKKVETTAEKEPAKITEKQEESEEQTIFSNPIIEEKCTYCGKILEDEDYALCEKCKKVKYCNNFCLNKDLRFHNKKCFLLKENKELENFN